MLHEQVAARTTLRQRHHVRSLAVFGSVLRDDIDLLDRSAIRNPYLRRNIEQTQETIYLAA